MYWYFLQGDLRFWNQRLYLTILYYSEPSFLGYWFLCIYSFVSSQVSWFLVKAFRAHQRQLVSICLIKADITPEKRFADSCLNRVMQYWLPYKNRDFPSNVYLTKIVITQVKQRRPANRVVHETITKTGSAHANPIAIFRVLI